MGRTDETYQDGSVTRQVQWVLMEAGNDNNDHDSDALTDSDIGECSDNSWIESSSSSDLVEDASSTSTSSSSSYGPLYELSELMAQLPIKMGLSQYYQGKSESFASLGSVGSLEDLAKKGNFMSYNRGMRGCKSFGDQSHRIRNGPKPKATIAKKASSTSRKSILSSSQGKKIENSLMGSFKSSMIKYV